ncbi:Uncharacterised protein [Citrobacter braakii]|nr:Uncharacterised protein [Citrobacter braakii]
MEPIGIMVTSNLSAGELFDLIFLEQFCDELGIGIESGAAILAGQPWLKTRQKPSGAIEGTSVVFQIRENASERCAGTIWY